MGVTALRGVLWAMERVAAAAHMHARQGEGGSPRDADAWREKAPGTMPAACGGRQAPYAKLRGCS